MTIKQIEAMQHAIGIKKDRIKYHKYIAFRNHFCCNVTNCDDWEDLVHQGYAERGEEKKSEGYTGRYYHVTDKGLSLLSKLMMIVILKG